MAKPGYKLPKLQWLVQVSYLLAEVLIVLV